MGECLTPVPVKLRAETVSEIDAVRAQLPLSPGRSTVARGLIEEVFLLIAEGILQFRSAHGNRLLSVSSNAGTQSIPGIPEELTFPSVEHQESPARAKPPRRVAPQADASRRAIIHRFTSVANAKAMVPWGTSFPLYFTRVRRVA